MNTYSLFYKVKKKRIFKHTTSFTLIELLVVVAIILLLAALLMPALRKAKDSARSVACVNNLHQIGIAIALYADANNRFAPPVNATPLGPIMTAWTDILATNGFLPTPVIGKSTVFVCPSQKDTVYNNWSRTYGLQLDPLYGSSAHTWPWRLTEPIGNRQGLIGIGPQTLTDFILVADSVLELPGDSGHRRQAYFVYNFILSDHRLHLRHNGKANILFAAGHVHAVGESELLNRYNWSNLDIQVP